MLWSLVRDKRLGGFKFRPQYPVEPYILDFYRDELKLAIELDGGQHALPAGSEADHKRHGFLASRGATVLRFSNLQMLKETESVVEHQSKPSKISRRSKSLIDSALTTAVCEPVTSGV